MSSNLPLVRWSHGVLPFLLCMAGGGGKLEINIPPIYANSKGGIIIEEGIMSSEYGKWGSTNTSWYFVQ